MTKEAGRPQLQSKLPEFYAVHAGIHNNSCSESKNLRGVIVTVHCHWGRAEFWTSTETPEDDMRAIASFLVVLTAVASTAVAIVPTSSLAETWPQSMFGSSRHFRPGLVLAFGPLVRRETGSPLGEAGHRRK